MALLFHSFDSIILFLMLQKPMYLTNITYFNCLQNKRSNQKLQITYFPIENTLQKFYIYIGVYSSNISLEII